MRKNLSWLKILALAAVTACLLTSLSLEAKTKGRRAKRVRPIQEPSGLTINPEVNVYRGATFVNLLVEYTTASEWSFGIQMLNAPIYGGQDDTKLDTYVVISKTTRIRDSWYLLAGAQNGTPLIAPHPFHSFEYLGAEYRPFEQFSFHAGPYFVNYALAGIHEPIGGWVGFEWEAVDDILHVQADWWSGHNGLSGSLVNFVLFPSSRLYGYLGVSLPAANSGNEFAGVIGMVLR